MLYLFGLDPSIEHTGWAVVKVDGEMKPVLCGSGVAKQKLDKRDGRYGCIYMDLMRYVSRILPSPFPSSSTRLAVVEKPHYERNSKRGKAAAKNKSLIKLSIAAGACISSVCELGFPYAFVTANQWKREIDKGLIRSRVEEYFPRKKGLWAREDEWEAIALCLWGKKHQDKLTIHKHHL